MYEDVMRLFEGVKGSFALYLQLEKWICCFCPQAKVQPKKTQISFSDGCVFAVASPPMRGGLGLTLTLCLPEKLSSKRILSAVEPYPGRWTHHIIIQREDELDEELTRWLQSAIAFARIRRR